MKLISLRLFLEIMNVLPISFLPINKNQNQHHHTAEEINSIGLHLARLPSFDGSSNKAGSPCHAIHGSIYNMTVEPGSRPPCQIEDYLFGNEQINFINIKFMIGRSVEAAKGVGYSFRPCVLLEIKQDGNQNS